MHIRLFTLRESWFYVSMLWTRTISTTRALPVCLFAEQTHLTDKRVVVVQRLLILGSKAVLRF